MKIKLLLFSALFLLPCLFGSCNFNGGEYVVEEDSVYFSYWTFSFGTLKNSLPEADPKTFQSLGDWLGKDAKHVYFKERLVPNADPATIKTSKYPLSHDNKDYYYEDEPLNVADVSSFKVLHREFSDIWAVDSKYAFYNSKRIENVDIATFKVQSFCVAKDKYRVYRFGEVVEGADPATYVENEKSAYSFDKNHVWYYGKLLEDVDRATFVIDDYETAHDKNGEISMGQRPDYMEIESEDVEADDEEVTE